MVTLPRPRSPLLMGFISDLKESMNTLDGDVPVLTYDNMDEFRFITYLNALESAGVDAADGERAVSVMMNSIESIRTRVYNPLVEHVHVVSGKCSCMYHDLHFADNYATNVNALSHVFSR